MKVIKPTPFNPSMLVSTTAPEPTAAWVSGTSYAKDAKVTYPVTDSGTTINHIFISLVSTNTATPGTDATKWLDLGPCNKCAMFDNQISTATIAPSPLVVVFKPGIFNSLALMGLTGNQLDVTVKDGTGGPIIYSDSFPLDGTIISDWYQYFFEPFVQKSEVVMTDIPPFSNSEITLTLTGGSDVQIGLCNFGTFYFLGDAEYGANVGITDYSRKDTDDFGVTTFVKRAYSKRMSARLMLDTAQINRVQRILADVRATPSVWIGADGDDYLPMLMLGYYRDFSIDIAYQNKSFCSLEIEGLI
jgi:hypothetical protein